MAYPYIPQPTAGVLGLQPFELNTCNTTARKVLKSVIALWAGCLETLVARIIFLLAQIQTVKHKLYLFKNRNYNIIQFHLTKCLP